MLLRSATYMGGVNNYWGTLFGFGFKWNQERNPQFWGALFKKHPRILMLPSTLTWPADLHLRYSFPSPKRAVALGCLLYESGQSMEVTSPFLDPPPIHRCCLLFRPKSKIGRGGRPPGVEFHKGEGVSGWVSLTVCHVLSTPD